VLRALRPNALSPTLPAPKAFVLPVYTPLPVLLMLLLLLLLLLPTAFGHACASQSLSGFPALARAKTGR